MTNSPLDIARDRVLDLIETARSMGGTVDDVYRALLRGQRQGDVKPDDQESYGYQIAALAEITGNAKYL